MRNLSEINKEKTEKDWASSVTGDKEFYNKAYSHIKTSRILIKKSYTYL